jgi:hypothetical protein
MSNIIKLTNANIGWKGMTLAGDAEHRTLRASGQLALLMIEQVE